MKILKSIFNWLGLMLGFKSELTDEAVRAGIVDFSVQGRNSFGDTEV